MKFRMKRESEVPRRQSWGANGAVSVLLLPQENGKYRSSRQFPLQYELKTSLNLYKSRVFSLLYFLR